MVTTIIKTRNAMPHGQYVRTSVDDMKDATDFRLLQVGPYVIRWRGGTTERVTERKLTKLQAIHSWAPDF